MSDGLLSEIVAEERNIRVQISALEREVRDRRELLRAELEAELQKEASRSDEEFGRSLESAAREARRDAESLVAAVQISAARLHALNTGELDTVIARHLAAYLQPEGDDDCQDEQARNCRPQGSAPRCP